MVLSAAARSTAYERPADTFRVVEGTRHLVTVDASMHVRSAGGVISNTNDPIIIHVRQKGAASGAISTAGYRYFLHAIYGQILY
jgi:hypothetical protein